MLSKEQKQLKRLRRRKRELEAMVSAQSPAATPLPFLLTAVFLQIFHGTPTEADLATRELSGLKQELLDGWHRRTFRADQDI